MFSEWATLFLTMDPSFLRHYAPKDVAEPLLSISGRLSFTIPFFVGHLVVALGCAIRDQAWRQLRGRFAFDLPLRKDHELASHGVYAFVRHPGYLGSIIFTAGIYVVLHDESSLLAALGLWNSPLGIAVDVVAISLGIVGLYCIMERIRAEEQALRERFGEQWVAWSHKTRYRVIPFVF